MIKTALKHYLYEFCINQMFDGFKRNLIMNNNINQIKVGDHYNYIFIHRFNNFNIKCFNCVVSEIYSKDVIIIDCTKFIDYDKETEVRRSTGSYYRMMVYKKAIIEIS